MSTRLFAGESFAIFPFCHPNQEQGWGYRFLDDFRRRHGSRRPGLRLARPGRRLGGRARGADGACAGGGGAQSMARPAAAPGVARASGPAPAPRACRPAGSWGRGAAESRASEREAARQSCPGGGGGAGGRRRQAGGEGGGDTGHRKYIPRREKTAPPFLLRQEKRAETHSHRSPAGEGAGRAARAARTCIGVGPNNGRRRARCSPGGRRLGGGPAGCRGQGDAPASRQQ